MTIKHILQHLYLVIMSGMFTIIFGLVLGISIYFYKSIRSAVLWIVDILQTIPVLALLGFIMIFFGASTTTVIIGLTLYALLPVVRNTYVGLIGIEPGIKEAAKGIGMNKWQQLKKVEIPNALPIIITGIRISIVTTIGNAVFAYIVGAGGLGQTIRHAMHIQNLNTILYATLVLVVMAVFFDSSLGYAEKKLKKEKRRFS